MNNKEHMFVRGEKEYRFAINKAVIQSIFFLRMQKGRHKVEKKELVRSFKDYLSKNKVFSEDIKLLVKSPMFANILLSLYTEKCSGAVKCLQILAI